MKHGGTLTGNREQGSNRLTCYFVCPVFKGSCCHVVTDGVSPRASYSQSLLSSSAPTPPAFSPNKFPHLSETHNISSEVANNIEAHVFNHPCYFPFPVRMTGTRHDHYYPSLVLINVYAFQATQTNSKSVFYKSLF